MCEEEEAPSDVIRRLFYLITAAAEDAAAKAVEGQSRALSPDNQANAATQLRAWGEMIEILASAIEIIVPTAASLEVDQS